MLSMMAHSWVYEGTRDATARTLTRETEGPDFAKGGRAMKFRDVIVLDGKQARAVTSRGMDKDGRWTGVVAKRCPCAG